jgi:hemolysin III
VLKVINHIKDPVSCLTHLAGAIASVFALMAMVYDAVQLDDPTRLIAVLIFGISMILLYTSSALYHMIKTTDGITLHLHKLDHTMIYVLIAGTYTPYCLLAMEGINQTALLYGIWSIAIIGIIVKLAWFNAPRWLSTVFYLLMGWIAVFTINRMEITEAALFWTVAGGIAYSIGAVIYIFKKPNPWPPHFGFHEIWHVFVLMGTFSHFWAVYRHL